MFISKLEELKSFDDITKFRLINAFLYAAGVSLLTPVLQDLRGELLTSTFITFILIAGTLAVKINKFLIDTFSMSSLYRIGVFVHLSFILSTLLYFYNKLYFIYLDSFISIIEIAIFSSYSITLSTYLAKHYPHDVSRFNIIKNSTYADATILGLGITWISSYFGNAYPIMIFLIFNSFFTIWLFSNWSFIQNKLREIQCGRTI